MSNLEVPKHIWPQNTYEPCIKLQCDTKLRWGIRAWGCLLGTSSSNIIWIDRLDFKLFLGKFQSFPNPTVHIFVTMLHDSSSKPYCSTRLGSYLIPHYTHVLAPIGSRPWTYLIIVFLCSSWLHIIQPSVPVSSSHEGSLPGCHLLSASQAPEYLFLLVFNTMSNLKLSDIRGTWQVHSFSKWQIWIQTHVMMILESGVGSSEPV